MPGLSYKSGRQGLSQNPSLGALGQSWARPGSKMMVTAAVSKSTRVDEGIESETKPEATAGSQQDLEQGAQGWEGEAAMLLGG